MRESSVLLIMRNNIQGGVSENRCNAAPAPAAHGTLSFLGGGEESRGRFAVHDGTVGFSLCHSGLSDYLVLPVSSETKRRG